MTGIWLEGPWQAGWALDYYSGDLGARLSRLKYRDPPDWDEVEPLAEAAAQFLRSHVRVYQQGKLAALVPVPPSQSRQRQPIEVLATRLGEKTKLPVQLRYIIKVRDTPPLRGVDDPSSRRQYLQGAFRVRDLSLAGKRVLLFDDVYRSGETLREITEALYKEGQVKAVYVLVLTKTRWRR